MIHTSAQHTAPTNYLENNMNKLSYAFRIYAQAPMAVFFALSALVELLCAFSIPAGLSSVAFGAAGVFGVVAVLLAAYLVVAVRRDFRI
jgi:hypothetical protein